MELTVSTTPAHTRRSGVETVVIPAGKTLRIETTPSGEEILSVEVPAGKQWTTYLMVGVQETNV
jgi:hypothetical protein